MTPDQARRRFATARIARLATIRPDGHPHLVPVVFATELTTIYTAVDAKPKRTTALQRLANVRADANVSLLADHYDDDRWDRLWWVRADGVARVLAAGDPESAQAIELLEHKYAQHRAARPPGPVLAVDVTVWTGWAAEPSD